MAETDERLQRAKELIDIVEGYISDAEFREEHETQLIRYMQAVSNALVAVSLQNLVIIDLLKQQGSGALSGS